MVIELTTAPLSTISTIRQLLSTSTYFDRPSACVIIGGDKSGIRNTTFGTILNSISSGIVLGPGSVIIGGGSHDIYGASTSLIAGGSLNSAASGFGLTILGGYYNTVWNSGHTVVVGGSGHLVANAPFSSITNGVGNKIEASNNSSIANGSSSEIDSSASTFISHSISSVLINATHSHVIQGFNNNITNSTYTGINNSFETDVQDSNYIHILNGGFNSFIDTVDSVSINDNFLESTEGSRNFTFNTLNSEVSASDDTIVAGLSCVIKKGNHIFVLGGHSHDVTNSTQGGILNGVNNTLNNAYGSFIIGGRDNIVNGLTGCYVLGTNIQATKNNTLYTNNLSVLNDFSSSRIILTAPNGLKYALAVLNDGTLTTVDARTAPVLVISNIYTGEPTIGEVYNGAIRCSASTPDGNVAPYSFYLSAGPGGSIRESGGVGGWFIADSLDGTQRDISISTTASTVWNGWVQDATGYGSNFEFPATIDSYPTNLIYP